MNRICSQIRINTILLIFLFSPLAYTSEQAVRLKENKEYLLEIEKFHNLYNASEYGMIYDLFDDSAAHALGLSPEMLKDALRQIRGEIGQFVRMEPISMKTIGTESQEKGYPAGSRVIAIYSFYKKQTGIEIFVFNPESSPPSLLKYDMDIPNG